MARIRHLDDIATVNVAFNGRPLNSSASSGSQSGDDELCVTLRSISISPSSVSDNQGAERQLTATGTYSDGSTLNLTSAVTWSSSDESLATVTNGSQGGLLSMLDGGSCTVAAALQGVSSNIPVAINGDPVLSGISSALVTTQSAVIGAAAFGRSFPLPSDASDIDLYASNRELTYVNPVASGVNFAAYYGWAGATLGFTGTPDVFANQTVPEPAAPGTGILEFLGPMSLSVGPGNNGKIFIASSVPTGRTISTCANLHHGWMFEGSGIVSPFPAATSLTQYSPWTLHLKYKTLRPRFLVFGDSISVGATLNFITTTGYEDAAWVQLAIANDWSVNLQGRPGATLAELAGNPTPLAREWDIVDITDTHVIIQRGTNDAINGLSQMQADLQTVVSECLSRGARDVRANTIAPAFAWAAYNSTRVAYNAWLKANWDSIGLVDSPCDLDAALRDPGDNTQLLAAYTTDSTHLTPAGQLVVKAAWQARLTSI